MFPTQTRANAGMFSLVHARTSLIEVQEAGMHAQTSLIGAQEAGMHEADMKT